MNSGTLTRADFWKYLLLGMAVLLNLTLLYRLIWGTQSLSVYQFLREKQASLEEEIAVRDEANAALSREIRLLQTDRAYMERAIRQHLNFVRDNEILYIFENGKKHAGATQ